MRKRPKNIQEGRPDEAILQLFSQTKQKGDKWDDRLFEKKKETKKCERGGGLGRGAKVIVPGKKLQAGFFEKREGAYMHTVRPNREKKERRVKKALPQKKLGKLGGESGNYGEGPNRASRWTKGGRGKGGGASVVMQYLHTKQGRTIQDAGKRGVKRTGGKSQV